LSVRATVLQDDSLPLRPGEQYGGSRQE
jgi:hypothetical protein